MSRKKLQKEFNINIISLIIGMILSASTSYVVAQTLVKSEDVYYDKTSSGLAVNNVQAAIDGTCTKFSNELSNFLNKIYPVGTIYTSTTSTNPSSFLGGTWEAYGKGQTLVGIDGNQTEFNTVGKTGGAKSVSYTPSGSIGSTGLTISQIPSHSHSYDKANSTTGSHTLTIAEIPSHSHSFVQGGAALVIESNANTSGLETGTGIQWLVKNGWANGATKALSYIGSSGGGGGHTHPISTTSTSTGTAGKGTTSDGHTHSFTGTAATINNLQPYITVYMWRRTK